MCDTMNASILQEIVDELVKDRKAFSAFDVTSEGKRRGTTERHGQMRGTVHRIMFSKVSNPDNPLDYTFAFIPTPSGVKARLWYPVGMDIQSEISRINGASTGNVPNDSPGFGTTAISTNTATKIMQAVDAEDRLPIYAKTLQQISMRTGDVVNVKNTGTELVIIPAALATPAEIEGAETHFVAQDGRIRISSKLLRECFGTAGIHFSVEVDEVGNRIIVK